jgi:hypothetical protein
MIEKKSYKTFQPGIITKDINKSIKGFLSFFPFNPVTIKKPTTGFKVDYLNPF